MKAVCVKGINSAANHHLLGLTQQLPTHPECRWNTIADEPFILTPIVIATFLSATQNLCVCVCTGVQTYSSPLISTRESWGQSEPRLMRGGESGRDKVGVRQVTRTMLHWCYSTIHPTHHAVTLKGHHPHGTHIDVWDCIISHVCTYAHESGCERVPVSVPWWSFYPFLPHVISLFTCLSLWKAQMWQHVSHIRENWYTRRKKKEGARQSCHSGLGICLFSIGVRRCCWEKSSLPDVIAEHCPGSVSADSYSEAESPAHFILSENFTLGSSYFRLKKLNNIFSY